jgi:7,8-dihydropterin-6-yl-methyl-4-(beta-D-ribofuranosyl)aminobenzene 5'-phosphate synthase
MERPGVLDYLRITVLADDCVLYESPYLGQHGASFLLEGVSGRNTKRLLVDVGQNFEALLYNMRTMGISPSVIDTIVLTHCHYDHTQGVACLLREIGRKDIQVIAHPSIFRLHFVTEPYPRHVGIMPGDSKAEIEKAGGKVFLTKDPVVIVSGIMTTGEVRRLTDFEKVNLAVKTVENGMVIDDLMLDDISVVANVKDKGLVIITGCSHAGIINIANQATEVAGCNKLESIIGGLHLIEAPDTVIDRTVEDLLKLNVAWISAGHCTGFKAQAVLHRTFAERFLPLRTGLQFELGGNKLGD